jgi:diguanylate cyclase (GGDEF)-like protein/PAS domain S-box-containing protein
MKAARARKSELAEQNSRLALELAEHKAVEAALSREKQFADDIVDCLPGIFYVVDERCRFVRWNRHFLEVCGYADEDVGHLHPSDLFASEEKACLRKSMQQAFTHGEALLEATLVTRQGERIPYRFTSCRTILWGRAYLLTLGIDISGHVALERELACQAHIDPLTGLCTRRHFMELAESELARTRRYGGTLSLLMLDLDRFKRINDTHGHLIGDRVLQTLGDTCRKVFRNIDIVGRIGGEEFAVLLPATDTPKACEVAERLRRNIEAVTVPVERGDALHFTASIGVSGLKGREVGIDTLLGLADKALYEAKHGGRNRVASYEQQRAAG